jgi:hypothetical protein
MLLCITPSPPSCAIEIARRDSVTVSIAEDINGMLSVIERVKRDSSLTAFGSTVECAGSKRTSSKVRASWAIRNIEIHTFYKKRSIQIYEIHVQIRRSISKLLISQRK